MESIRLIGDKAINNILKDKDGVQDAVRDEAEQYAETARMYLARHRDRGDSHIETDHSGVDSEVALVDERGGALGIEFGRDYENGSYSHGIHAVTWGLIN